MKARKWMALAMSLLLLIGMLPAATASEYGTPEATESYCTHSVTGTHRWSDWYVESEATCTSGGSRMRICENGCGYQQWESTPRRNHDWGAWQTTREATCAKAGSRTRKCRTCGRTEEDAIAKLPHTWNEWQIVKEATDHSAGERTHSCKVCGETQTQSFDPEGTLRRGDHGDAVKALQEGLICYGALKAGGADGSFGPGTESAVKQAQEAEGLAVDGVAWPQTQARLGHVFGEWTVVSEKTDFSIGVRERTCARCGLVERGEDWPSPLYRRGDKGEGVSALQEALNAAGYDCGRADGDFGRKTENAVKALQTASGLEADGIAWPGVLKLLGLGGDWAQATVAGGLAFDPGEGAPALHIGGIVTGSDGALSIEVAPGSIVHTGSGEEESIVAEILVTNTGEIPVDLVSGVALNDGFAATSSDLLLAGSADGELVEDSPVPLAPGETASLWLNTAPGAADLNYGAFYRVVEVVARMQGDEAPESEVYKFEDILGKVAIDTCVLLLPIHPVPGQKLRLTQNGCTVTGEGIDSELTVALRAENLTDAPLTVDMFHYDAMDNEYWEHFVEWQGEGWGTFTLAPHAALDFGVLLRPFPYEAEEGVVHRWLKAWSMGMDELYATLELSLWLDEERGLAIEGEAEENAPALGAGEDFKARLTAVNATDMAFQSVRFLGEVLGPKGELLHELEIEPENTDIAAPGSTDADLVYTLTEEDAALGELTFVVWAFGLTPRGDEATLIPAMSSNTWRHTMRTEGEAPTNPGEAPGDAVVSLSLSEGDRYYRPGEPIPLDIIVTAQGDHPLENLQVWLEPVEPGTRDFIYEDFGDLVIDTSAPGGGYVSLEPGKPWVCSRYDALSMPLAVAQRRPFDIVAYVDLYDPFTGEVFERTARVSVSTRIGTGALTFEATTDATGYRPGEPIEFVMRAVNDDVRNMEFLTFHARHAAPDEMDDSVIELVSVWSKEVIKPGDVREKTYTYVPTEEDAQKGALAFILSANVFYEGEVSPCAEIRRVITLEPIEAEEDGEAAGPKANIGIKAAPKGDTFRVGEPLEIPLTITNTGNEPLRGVDLTARRFNAAGMDTEEIIPLQDAGKALPPGESMEYVYSYMPDGTEGSSLHFILIAAGVGGETKQYVHDSADCYYKREAGDDTFRTLRIVAAPSWNDDGFIHYVLTVENAGNAPVSRVKIVAQPLDIYGNVHWSYNINDLSGSFTLEAGGSADATWDFEPDVWVVQDGVSKVRFRVAAVEAGSGAVVEGATTAEFTLPEGFKPKGTPEPLEINCMHDFQTIYGEGKTAVFNLTIRNTTNMKMAPLTLSVTIQRGQDGGEETRELATWEQGIDEFEETFKYEYTVTAEDVASGFLKMTFRAEALDANDEPQVATVEQKVYTRMLEYDAKTYNMPMGGYDTNGALEIVKTVLGGSEYPEGYHLFEYINYAVTVTNHSPDGVQVSVYDACAGGTPDALGSVWLPPDESATFPYAHEVGKFDVAAGKVENDAYAVIDQITENSTVFGVGETFHAAPVIVPTTHRQPDPMERPDEYRVEVRKRVLGTPLNGEAYALGEEVLYEITVTNPTDNTINAAWIFEAPDGCEPESLGCVTLGFGQSVALLFRYVVTEQDVAAGQIRNRAFARLALVNEAGDVEEAVFESDVVTVAAGGSTPPETSTSELIPPETATGESTPPETSTSELIPPETGEETPGTEERTAVESPAPDAGDYCRRVLTGRGEGIETCALICCAGHRAAMEAFEKALAEDSWQAACALLRDAVRAEYDRLAARMPNPEDAALAEADRDVFFGQLNAFEALLAHEKGADAAARAIAEELLNQLIDLCHARHTAPHGPADSLTVEGFESLSPPETGICRSAVQPGTADAPPTYTQMWCPDHAAIESRLTRRWPTRRPTPRTPRRSARRSWPGERRSERFARRCARAATRRRTPSASCICMPLRPG